MTGRVRTLEMPYSEHNPEHLGSTDHCEINAPLGSNTLGLPENRKPFDQGSCLHAVHKQSHAAAPAFVFDFCWSPPTLGHDRPIQVNRRTNKAIWSHAKKKRICIGISARFCHPGQRTLLRTRRSRAYFAPTVHKPLQHVRFPLTSTSHHRKFRSFTLLFPRAPSVQLIDAYDGPAHWRVALDRPLPAIQFETSAHVRNVHERSGPPLTAEVLIGLRSDFSLPRYLPSSPEGQKVFPRKQRNTIVSRSSCRVAVPRFDPSNRRIHTHTHNTTNRKHSHTARKEHHNTP